MQHSLEHVQLQPSRQLLQQHLQPAALALLHQEQPPTTSQLLLMSSLRTASQQVPLEQVHRQQHQQP